MFSSNGIPHATPNRRWLWNRQTHPCFLPSRPLFGGFDMPRLVIFVVCFQTRPHEFGVVPGNSAAVVEEIVRRQTNAREVDILHIWVNMGNYWG